MVYLKTVEAYGFKSFADKTQVKFDKGLTAIVGPNGSGKSNITDAIRWVLGEQSAKNLRGARMEDVIFSGAEHHKALNYAEVKLLLDNQDGLINGEQQIEVTRRLYRSGESEYFLNGIKVRLKDITELFLDTGLGKEAFSIISQGKVDEILNAKSEDRRHLIEEAAGVLKYKKRRRETETKLEETLLNLARVNDILFDLEGRVEPLKEEAAIAKEYQELMKEMRDADIQVSVYDIEQLKKTYAKLEQDIHDFTEMIALKQHKAETLESSLNEQRNLYQQSQQTLQQLHTRLLTLTETIERKQGQYHLLKEKEENHNQSSARIMAEIEKLNDVMAGLTKEQQSLTNTIEQTKQDLQSVKKEEKLLEQQLTDLNSDMEQLIEDNRDKYYETISVQTQHKNEIKLIDRQLEAIEQTLNHNGSQFDVDTLNAVKADVSSIQNKLSDNTQKLERTRTDYKKLNDQINIYYQNYKLSEEKLYKAYRFIEQLKSKYDSFIAMQEEYQGYFQGVRLILKERRQLTGIHGAVAELIQVDETFQTALDIALGTQLQSIVTADEQSARQAIDYLKKKRAGRATFLPLKTIKERRIPANIIQQIDEDGMIGILSDLITVDTQYRKIIEHLAGLTIVSRDLTAANRLARVLNYKYRIVTLDGNIVNPGGSMTGGSVNQPSALLKQREELNKVKTQLEKYQTSTASLESETAALKAAHNRMEVELNDLRLLGESLAELQQTLTLDLVQAESELKEWARAEENYQSALKQQEEQSQLHLKKSTLESMIVELDLELTAIEQNIENYTRAAVDRKTEEQHITQTLSTCKSERIMLDERLKHYHIRQSNLDEEIQRLKINLQELMTTEDVSSEEMSARIETLSAELSEAVNDREEVEIELQQLKTAQLEDEALLAANQSKYNELLRQINGLENGIGEMKGNYSRIDVQLENLLYHLMEDYHMTYESATAEYDDYSQIDQLRKRVKLTKVSIEELGHVNIGAIKQYEEVKERYDFLSEQESDLRAAEQTLESIIKEMDQTVTEKFEQTFKAVQQHFSIVFKELFGGGSGELVLNSEDILTAGIDIIIEPPGKKRQHLTLLSGGERALTAVALLFSILKVRSAPFVILDEVEAALDEANVLRFGHYLQKLSDTTQFIVITHRKGTMESADRLYGVTMQNSGVTQLVSVNLNELNHDKVKELTQ